MSHRLASLAILGTVLILAGCPDTSNIVAPPPPPPPPPAATSPAAPSNLITEFTNSSRIDLRWVDNANDEVGYRLERCAGTGCTNFALLTSFVANVTATADVGLSSSTTYRYRIQAYNAVGGSTFAGPVSATTLAAATAPAAPTNFTATYVSLNRVDLAWVDNATNEDEYDLERCTGAGCTNFVKFSATAANATSYQANAPLQPSTTYRYRVYAINGAGQSSALTATIATPAGMTLPAAPASFTATAVSSTQITLAWTDQATNEDGFHIERCSGAGCANYVLLADAAANATSLVNGSLTPNTTYRYRIQSFNTAGVSITVGPATATTSVAPAAPAAPTGLTATAVSSSQINLAWTDVATNEDGYKVERCSGAGCSTYTLIATLAANTTSYQSTGLTASTPYSYRVIAFIGSVNSANAGPATATTPAALLAPTLNAPGVSGSSVTVSWSYTWTGLGCSCDGYQLEESTTSASSGFSVVHSPATRTSPYSITLTGRAAGTYYYRVRAVTGSGATPYSAVQSAVIANQTQRISLTNNLDGTGGNQVLRFRVAASTTALYSPSNTTAERLSPDNYCGSLPGQAVDPGETQVFDVSANAPNYYVYIGLGKWDNTDLSGNQTCWQKKNWAYDGSNLLYLFAAVSWNGHTSGTNQWTITYDAQNHIVLRTSSGDIAFLVSTNADPIR